MPEPIVTPFDHLKLTYTSGEQRKAYLKGYLAATEVAQARTAGLVEAAERALKRLLTEEARHDLHAALEAYRKGESNG